MLDAIRWDWGLVHRYGHALSHYGCYPPPRQFVAGVGAFELLRALRSSRLAQRPLSLYLHLPFAAVGDAGWRNGVIGRDRRHGLAYLQRLEREIERVGHHLGPGQRVEQLYWGGTPTFLDHQQLRRLMTQLRQRFALLEDDSGDYAIDIDPREADWPTLGLLRELGFNRLNIGVHDLDPQVQQATRRRYSPRQLGSLLEAARTLHYRAVNLELRYGLPQQSAASFARTLAAVLALQPDRLTLRAAAGWPGVGQRERLERLREASERLNAAGYRYIGLGQFVLPDDELAMAQEGGRLRRDLQGYSGHARGDLIGLGLCAISRVGALHAQNSDDPARYQACIDSGQLATRRGLRCTADDQLRQALIETLVCDFQLDMRAIEARFDLDFRDYFAAQWPGLEQLAGDGLIELGEDFIDVRPVGRLLVGALCRLFDRDPPAEARPLSRVV
ncbi:radical SAM protein [Pseudomonas zhanjiangensis]|uniref:Coproporphyrinogen-III oxidase n=1 Tax=Pseudomonas zhanjiangensis TaxID=3239015 RepID=A0ABV3Z1D5_9PSED